MSFNTFIQRPISQKIVLFEMDLPFEIPFWLPYQSGIWYYNMVNFAEDTVVNFENGAFCYGNFENASTVDTGINGAVVNPQSLSVDGANYTKCDLLNDCISNEASFFFDTTTNFLYVHFEDSKWPSNFALIEVGLTDGFSNQDIYLNDQFYSGRIQSIPSISMQRDRNFFGMIEYSGGDITLNNLDGHFDSYTNQTLFGQKCRIKFGGDDLVYADYRQMFTGYVEKTSTDTATFSVSIADLKKKIDRSLPVNFFDTTTYPNIKDANAGKAIPIAYGLINNAPVICYDEDSPGGGSYHFKLCDVADHPYGINAITTVLVNGVAQVPSTTDLTNAEFTFTVAGGLYSPGDDVSCTFEGYADGSSNLIDNSLDILKDIFTVYQNIIYNTTNYDTTNWTASTLLAKDIGFFIDSDTSLTDIIEIIGVSNQGNLIIDNDGKLNFKFLSPTDAPVIVIKNQDIFDSANKEDDGTEYLTSVKVSYYKDYGADKFRDYTYNARQTEIYNQFKVYRTREYETYLTSESDAQALALAINSAYDTIIPIFKRTVSMESANLELLDNYTIQIDRVASTWMGLVKNICIGIEYDFMNFKINLTGLFVGSYYDEPSARWASDTVRFPNEFGGEEITASTIWNDSWTYDKKKWFKEYAAKWQPDSVTSIILSATDDDSDVTNVWKWKGDL